TVDPRASMTVARASSSTAADCPTQVIRPSAQTIVLASRRGAAMSPDAIWPMPWMIVFMPRCLPRSRVPAQRPEDALGSRREPPHPPADGPREGVEHGGRRRDHRRLADPPRPPPPAAGA